MTPRTADPSRIWSHDLSPVTRRLLKKGFHDAPRLEAEFRKLAALWSLHPTASLAPSAKLDEFWHEFVLDTARYRAFCAEVYGAHLDHIPDDAGTGMMAEYEATKDLYRRHFGEPDPAVWGLPGPNSMGRIHAP